MNMAESFVPSRTAPSQGSAREARVKDSGSAAAAQGGDDGGFRDVMSDLADRADAKRAGSPGQSDGTEKSGTGGRSQPSAKDAGTGEASEAANGEVDAAVEAARSALQSGSLLAQVALALAPVAGNAAGAAPGETLQDLQPLTQAGDLQSLLETTRQLSAFPAIDAGSAQQGQLPSDDTAVSAALAALSEGIDDATIANISPDSPGGPDAPRAESSDGNSFSAMMVTVAGDETHFAPVQSAERVLSRILGGTSAGTNVSSRSTGDSAAMSEDEDANGKTAAVAALAGTEGAKPVAGTGSGMDAGSEREGSGSERRLPEGQTSATSADQQGLRASGVAAASEFQAVAASEGSGLARDTSPAAQIARKIGAELADPVSRTAQSTSSADGVVKVLHLKLEPANLGSVTVRLALKDDVISIHVEASRHETAFAIERDREALSNALKSAGYVVDNVSTQAADPARPSQQVQPVSNDGQMSSSLQSQSDPQSGAAQSGRRNQGDQSRQSPDNPFAPGPGVNESRGAGSRSASGALYV